MTENAMHGVSRAFCDALASHDPGRLAPWLDENVDWMVFGPVELFPFFGKKEGKAAVLDMVRTLIGRYQLVRCDSERTVTGEKDAASLLRLTVIDRRNGRTLSLRFAQFARFENGRLVSLLGLFDSFDAVEQALGIQIDLSAVA